MRRVGKATQEAELIDAARQGDRLCFDKLVARHMDRLRAFIDKRVPTSDVEDICQEALLAAWRAMPSFEGRSEFRTWLLGIAQFKAQDFFRRSRFTTFALDDVSKEVASPGCLHERLELAESLRPILESLGSPRADIIKLYYGKQLTLDEISRELKIHPSTVKYHLYQAHQTVAEALKKGGPLV